MSCQRCGRDCGGSSSYCPTCSAWTYMAPVPAISPLEQREIDRILEELVRIRTLLHELVQNRRNA